MAMMFCSRSRNQGSMPVRCATSMVEAPRRRAAVTAHRRSSVASRGREIGSSCQLGSSQSRERPPISRLRIAFCSAASKLRSIAMTSPVAFICVPIWRSPNWNLSKGQRGILTTQ